MKYIVMRTDLRTLRVDYYIGGGSFMIDISFAKTYNNPDECHYFDKSVVSEKSFAGEVLNKHIYTIVEK